MPATQEIPLHRRPAGRRKPWSTDPAAEIAEAVAGGPATPTSPASWSAPTPRVESEGFDRESLDLPGRQDELVAAVAAANPRTVVVVNSGSPVLMPWRNRWRRCCWAGSAARSSAAAVADILLGVREPGGRLPTTWPATVEDVPVLDTTPVEAR